MWKSLPERIRQGDSRALSRAISLVENEVDGYQDFLRQLISDTSVRITGITGPPGAGKSTLTDGLIDHYTSLHQRVCVICVDPSSAFTGGAILGDRIRMRRWYDHPDVFIRSLSTRGALGGLNASIIEVADILAAYPCDHIIIETVGVGQSETEIASLADTTVVVQIPEGGDDIQTMKAGLLEIADIFVVNKCDRPGAEIFVNNLRMMLHDQHKDAAIIQTVASSQTGIEPLAEAISSHVRTSNPAQRVSLLARRAVQLVLRNKMKSIDREKIEQLVRANFLKKDFNLYRLIGSL